jgi:hypothetical protein
MVVGMGFRMKNKIFLTLILLVQALGCMKAPEKKIEYGQEVPVDLVVKVMKTAIGPSDSPEQILKDEFLNIETTREIRGRPEIDLLSQVAITVVDRKVTKNQWQIKNTEEIKNYDLEHPSDSPPAIIREDHQCINKNSFKRETCEIEDSLNILDLTSKKYKESMNDLTNTSRHFNFLFEDQIYPFKQLNPKSNSDDEPIITFHNLSSEKVSIAPPKAVVESEKCNNIPNCKINVTVVEFDQVNWAIDLQGYKIHYKFVISPDVPQLSRRLQVCKQGSVQVRVPDKPIEEAPRFLVTFCDTVVNFKSGSL